MTALVTVPLPPVAVTPGPAGAPIAGLAVRPYGAARTSRIEDTVTIMGEAAAALARFRAVNGANARVTAGDAVGVGNVMAESAYLRRMHAAMAREVAVMLGVAPSRVVVSADPARGYGDGAPGTMIIVYDSDEDHRDDHPGDDHRPDHRPDTEGGPDGGPGGEGRVWRFVPEIGNTGLGGGAYLLLDECPAGCGGADPSFGVGGGIVPMVSVSTLADLGRYLEFTRLVADGDPDPDEGEDDRPEVPVEFFDDPGHGTGCTMR